jgi:cytochrome c peroxidase
MKSLKIVIFSSIIVGLVFSFAFASGDVVKGKALFNDPKLGGKAGKSCNSCHPDGKGLEKAADKKEFNLGGKKQNGIEEAVNFCIEMTLKGKAIDPKGTDMSNMVAYIKSIAKKSPSPAAGY